MEAAGDACAIWMTPAGLRAGVDAAVRSGPATVVPAGVASPQCEGQVRAEISGPVELCARRQQQPAFALVRQHDMCSSGVGTRAPRAEKE
jgi:hypothetical protein